MICRQTPSVIHKNKQYFSVQFECVHKQNKKHQSIEGEGGGEEEVRETVIESDDGSRSPPPHRNEWHHHIISYIHGNDGKFLSRRDEGSGRHLLQQQVHALKVHGAVFARHSFLLILIQFQLVNGWQCW